MAYDRYEQDLKKAGMAKAMNTASDKFRAMREARVKQERDREIFSLDKQQKQLELKKMEMDPTIDPGYRSIVQKKIKLGMQESDLQLKKQQKALEYQTYDTQQQIEHLGKQAAALNQLTERNPEMFGDMMIVPDLANGTVTLKQRTSKGRMSEYQNLTVSMQKQKALEAIKSGKVYDKRTGLDATTELTSPDDIVAYVTSLNVNLNDPDVKSALAEKFPEKYGGAAGGKILMTAPDGNQYEIPKENVEKAKARGFK